jgi:chaperonin cofactor prefoldin
MSFFTDFTAHHKLGLIVFFGILALLFVHEFRNKSADVTAMEKLIQANKQDYDKRDADNKAAQDNLQKQLAAIAAQKQQVIQVPSSAPTIIRETIPMQQPFQPTQPITKDTKPTDVVGQLTLQQTQDLATFGLSCKECTSKLATLQVQDANKDQQISDLKNSLKTAEDTAKGGSVFKRTMKVIGVVGCAGGGAWLGSKSGGGPKGAAIGGVIATTGCALKFHF